jgi:hypothetical protein
MDRSSDEAHLLAARRDAQAFGGLPERNSDP